MTTLREAAQQFVTDYENGDLGDMKHYARALRAALAQQEQEPLSVEDLARALVASRVIDAAALDDPEGYDDGVMLERVRGLHRRLAALAQQEQEPVAWLEAPYGAIKANPKYRIEAPQTVHWKVPLYANLPRAEPEPPPEPLHEDKIRAEFREMDRCCLPGEMTVEDWFTEGVRFAEKHHEIV